MESSNNGAEKDTAKLNIQFEAVHAAMALDRIQEGNISEHTTQGKGPNA